MNTSQSRPLPTWPLFFIVALLCSTARAHSDDLIDIDPNAFPGAYYRIILDHNGDYVTGEGDGYGGGWQYYPDTGWYRMWFYNEPFSTSRQGYLYYKAFITAHDYSRSVSFDVRFNWTTPAWSALGRSRPPLPSDAPTGADEIKYMSNEVLQAMDGVFLGSPESPGSVEPMKSWTVRDYNPEWVSIDIKGRNCDIHRGVYHECRDKMGACYNPNTRDCTLEYQEDCEAPYQWLGSGTSCSDAGQPTTQYDFGDAPDTYGTTTANNGARHAISAGVCLGADVDSETNGKPTASATGDDDSRDDEDGVQFTSILSPGESATVDVTASTQGYLNAWMDFDGDGSFDGKEEQIFSDQRLASGLNHLSFRIPANAVAGDTYARFRFNSRGLLSYYGPAQDGEVEDYKVSLVHAFDPQINSGKGGLKWSQPAKSADAATPFLLNGWDEVSSLHLHQISADDWQCTDERPITGFQWWGSFEGWTQPMLPAVLPLAFQIGIWTDAPGKAADSNHPDTLIWEMYCTHWTWNLAGQDDDPRGINRGETCFQFTCLLSQDQWFYQSPTTGTGGTVYWLSIAAVYDTDKPAPANPWGWTTRPYSFNNAAARVAQVAVGTSRTGSWPPVVGVRWLAGESVQFPKGTKWDLAFELLTNQAGSEAGQPPVGSDLAPVYRFWSEKLNTHFYTISTGEKDALVRDWSYVWAYEGIVFYAYPPEIQPVGARPVYRFWSNGLGRHFYTMDEREKRTKESQSEIWTLEGVAWNTFEGPPAK
ncbi:MAG: hypothetical protein JW955_12130 [Sedimentisphaerales bacterium]|nr:hypothetical protein [Sedimentisphaerales bacterium]